MTEREACRTRVRYAPLLTVELSWFNVSTIHRGLEWELILTPTRFLRERQSTWHRLRASTVRECLDALHRMSAQCQRQQARQMDQLVVHQRQQVLLEKLDQLRAQRERELEALAVESAQKAVAEAKAREEEAIQRMEEVRRQRRAIADYRAEKKR